MITKGPRHWPHQIDALKWIHARRGSLLWIPPGGGKSRILVDYVQNVTAKEDYPRVIVMCPLMAARNTWPWEFEKYWAGPPARMIDLHTGSVKQRADRLFDATNAQIPGETLILSVNYDAARSEPLASELIRIRAHLIAFDECHKLKAPGGTTSKYAEKLTKGCKRIVGLTGTPMGHGCLDLFGQLRSIAPGVLGYRYTTFRDTYAVFGKDKLAGYRTLEDFKADFVETGSYGLSQMKSLDQIRVKMQYVHERVIVGYRRQHEFTVKLNTVCFRVGEEEIEKSLPPTQDIPITVDLPAKAQRIYDDLEAELCASWVAEDEQSITASNALVKMLRLQELAGGFIKADESAERQAVHTEKADAIAELFDSIDPKEKIVVFCRFSAEIRAIAKTATTAGRLNYLLVGGADELRKWKQAQPGSVLIVQIQAGAEAVDFTEARYQIYASLSHSLTLYDQSRKRIWRQGQSRPVTYYHIIARGTIDEDIYDCLDNKRNVINGVRAKIIDRRRTA